MPDPIHDDFIELENFWISITRKSKPIRGLGKWMLHTEQPHRLYKILREALKAGKLKDAFSIKTKAQEPSGGGAVYVFSGPYTDREKLLRLAEQIRLLNDSTPLKIDRPLIFKTDLHNTWCESLSRPGDGYHQLLKRSWIYRYQGGELIVKAAILALHQALEDPPQDADPEFLIIRSMLPNSMFAGKVET